MGIIFVTGVSTAGKSTAYNALRKDRDLADVEFHDIDEDGVPPAGGNGWRQFRVELLLHEAAERFLSEAKSTVICGITKPHEVIESQSYPEKVPVDFILIDIAPVILAKRLRARLEGHVSEDDIVALIQSNRLLADMLRKSVINQRNGIFAPKTTSKLQVSRGIKQLIEGLLP